jgi:putative sigma-54 modulation protein
MDITIKGKNCEVADDLILYTERKLSKLAKLSHRIQSVTVTYIENSSKKRNQSSRVEIVLAFPGQSIRAEDENETAYLALDSALDKLRRQLKKVKTKRLERTRTTAVAEPPAGFEAAEPGEAVELSGPTVFVERFNKKPISTTEAIMELKLSSRKFMLFVNEANSVNCVYLRSDGSYGLVVPEDEIIE